MPKHRNASSPEPGDSVVQPLPFKGRSYLDELMDQVSVDDIGLLDLLYAEEIVRQEEKQ